MHRQFTPTFVRFFSSILFHGCVLERQDELCKLTGPSSQKGGHARRFAVIHLHARPLLSQSVIHSDPFTLLHQICTSRAFVHPLMNSSSILSLHTLRGARHSTVKRSGTLAVDPTDDIRRSVSWCVTSCVARDGSDDVNARYVAPYSHPLFAGRRALLTLVMHFQRPPMLMCRNSVVLLEVDARKTR